MKIVCYRVVFKNIKALKSHQYSIFLSLFIFYDFPQTKKNKEHQMKHKKCILCLWTCMFEHILCIPGLSLYSLALSLILFMLKCCRVTLLAICGKCCWINKINFFYWQWKWEGKLPRIESTRKVCFVLVWKVIGLTNKKINMYQT